MQIMHLGLFFVFYPGEAIFFGYVCSEYAKKTTSGAASATV